ncbi:MAG: hypothetical protein ACOCRO_09105 [Halanaerobiales bacterium]
MKIIKKFKSKKNNVFLVKQSHKKKVVKQFKERNKFEKELEVYKGLDGCLNLVPKLYSYDLTKKEFCIEYIEGDTLIEYLEYAENDKRYDDAIDILIGLINWVNRFHSCNLLGIKNHVLYDVNFKNFIISNNKIFGLDFEDVKEGNFLDDFIKVLSMYLYYDPIKSKFKIKVFNRLVTYFSNEFDICKNQVLSLVRLEETNILQRRSRYKSI